jgi:hypothetical protein
MCPPVQPIGWRLNAPRRSESRGQWNEVGLVGLEDLAYMATSLRIIKRSCPGVVPGGSGALMGFALSLSWQSVERVMRVRCAAAARRSGLSS